MAITFTACQPQPARHRRPRKHPSRSATETAATSMATEAPATVTETTKDPAATTAIKKAEYRKITAEEAKARMDSGDLLIILDVRTQGEYDSGHIAGAVLLPDETIGTENPAVLPDMNAEILVYCRSGNRSQQAAQKLVAMGYTNVYDFGGISAWTYGTVTN